MSFASRTSLYLLALGLLLISPSLAQSQSSSSDPNSSRSSAESAVRAGVERYFALYAAKDLGGLICLWSEKSPDYASHKQNLQQEFETENTSFNLPAISQVKMEGEKVSLRAMVNRTSINLKSNQKREQRIARNFAFVKEDGKWKIWRYATAENDLAEALADAKTEAERARLLVEEKDLVTAELVGALNTYSRRLSDQGNTSKALASFNLAIGLGEQIGDRNGIGDALNDIGLVHWLQGDYARALELFRKGLDIREAQEDKLGTARILNNFGMVYRAQGDYDLAAHYYRKSLALFEALDRKKNIAIVLGNLGVVCAKKGDLAQAMDYYKKSLALSESEGDKLGVAITLGNIGAIHMRQGNDTQALDYYRKSLTLSEAIDDKVGIAQMLSNMGIIYRSHGNYAQALENYQKSLALSEILVLKGGTANALSSIGRVYSEQGDYARASEYYQKSLAMWEAIGDKDGTAITLSQLGRISIKQGRHAEAIGFAERAVTLARQMGSLEILLDARINAGLAHRHLNQPRQAYQAFEEAINIVETMRAQVAGMEQEQQGFFESKVAPYLAMATSLIADGRTTEALIFTERAKARVLLDVLQAGRVSLTKAMTGPEQEQERKLILQLVSFNTQISRAKSVAQPDRERLMKLGAELQKARLDLEAFRIDLYTSHPELRGQRGETSIINAEELAALLPDSTSALLEYVVTDDATYLFVVTKPQRQTAAGTRVFTIPIKQTDLAKQIESFRRRLAERNLNFRASAQKLYDLLLKPAQSLLRGKSSLVIAPDDRLWELPFQALPDERDRYLIERSAVSYAPSLTVLREMRARSDKRRASSSSSTLLALGNPVIGQETVERARLTMRDEKLSPLPEAEAEVRALGRLYGARHSKIYIGAEAREDRLKAEAGQARILHFATHGVLNNAAPLYSYLALAQGDKNEDGLLEAWELMQLDLKADLAVLSACETARGRTSAGEGVIGLTWALFVAGTPATVVSQWEVESASARDLMLCFHRQLQAPRTAGKLTKAESLRRAAIKMMKNPATSHPFYWASFVLVGDGR
jgi:CHAT domain-containing protein/tetratricopeptide (TPR) repeat protein